MHVAVNDDFTFSLYRPCKIFGGPDHGCCVRRRVAPAPIHVLPEQVGPLVSANDALNVHHRHDIEDKVLAQRDGALVFTEEEVDDAFEAEAGLDLACVHPGCNNDCSLAMVHDQVFEKRDLGCSSLIAFDPSFLLDLGGQSDLVDVCLKVYLLMEFFEERIDVCMVFVQIQFRPIVIRHMGLTVLGDDEEWAVEAGRRLAEDLPSHNFRLAIQLPKILLQVARESIGPIIREGNCLIRLGYCVDERKSSIVLPLRAEVGVEVDHLVREGESQFGGDLIADGPVARYAFLVADSKLREHPDVEQRLGVLQPRNHVSNVQSNAL